MGQLLYGPGTVYEMDDRTLAHVKLALVAKLRRQDGFLVSWPLTGDRVGGRVSLWVSAAIPLQFVSTSGPQANINRAWILAMLESSNGERGLVVLTEAEAIDAAH